MATRRIHKSIIVTSASQIPNGYKRVKDLFPDDHEKQQLVQDAIQGRYLHVVRLRATPDAKRGRMFVRPEDVDGALKERARIMALIADGKPHPRRVAKLTGMKRTPKIKTRVDASIKMAEDAMEEVQVHFDNGTVSSFPIAPPHSRSTETVSERLLGIIVSQQAALGERIMGLEAKIDRLLEIWS